MSTSAPVRALRGQRIAAVAGLAYVLFFVASLTLPSLLNQYGDAPIFTPYSSDALVARYLAETSRGLVPVAAFFQAMSALALLVFVPYAAAESRRWVGVGGHAGLVRATGTVAAAFLLFSASIQWVLNRPSTGASLPVYRAVADTVFITGAAPQVAATGLLTGALAVAALKSRALPAWLNWLGLAVATLATLSMLSFLSEPATIFIPLGRYLGMVWFLGLAAVLLRRGATRTAVPAEPGQPTAFVPGS